MARRNDDPHDADRAEHQTLQDGRQDFASTVMSDQPADNGTRHQHDWKNLEDHLEHRQSERDMEDVVDRRQGLSPRLDERRIAVESLDWRVVRWYDGEDVLGERLGRGCLEPHDL